jgi:hypothetical protein
MLESRIERRYTNTRHKLEVTLEDDDGAPLLVPTPMGEQPLRLGSELEAGRPPGATRGSSFNIPVAIPLLPLPWVPGRGYIVSFVVDGEELDRVRFTVRPAPRASGPPAPEP